MVSVRNYIRINPIDLNQNKAIGVSLPFDGTVAFNSTFTSKEQLKSNLLNILLTEPGERIFNPNFGVGLRNYLFENFTNSEELEIRIRNQIRRYAPQTDLSNVTVENDRDAQTLRVGIFYRIKVNNELDAIQINFSPDNMLSGGTSSSPTTNTGNMSSGGASGGSSGGSGGGGY